jgi:hypothetical protein
MNRFKVLVFKFIMSRLTPFLARVLLFLKVNPTFVFKRIISGKLLMPANQLNPVRNRVPTFGYVISILSKTKNPLIVETGCSRIDHGLLAWGDDGCSTFLYDIFTLPNHGKVISVDINVENVKHANSKTSQRVKVFCDDSVNFLSRFTEAGEIDLLYLDSFDFDPNNPEPSQNHHLKEIEVIFDRLKPGCLILVDDAGVKSETAALGKAGKVFDFMESKGVYPKIQDYQLLWIKP